MSHGGGGISNGLWGALFFLAFVAIVIFAFLYFPPPTNFRFSGSQFPTSTTPGAIGNRTVLQGPSGGAPNRPSQGASTSGAQSATSKVAPQDIPKGFTVEQLSPYFHKVRLGSVYAGGYGGNGQVTLSTYFTTGEQINVTGWRIQGNRGGSVYVPKAVRVYDAAGLTPETDIVLKSGDQLYLYSSGQSGVGKNLRGNKCLGYLPAINNFKPAISQSCPYVDREEITSFSGQCQNYILSLGCRLPDMSDIRIPRNEDSCRTFLTTLNYQGCVSRHVQDKDFLQNQVYAWISNISLDQYHDKARLLDENGLIVDVYEY